MEISAKDVNYIMNFKKLHLRNYLIKWNLTENADGSIILNGKFNPFYRILLTPIIVIIMILYSLYDGGLISAVRNIKELNTFFSIGSIKEYENHYYENNRYYRMKNILNKN